MKNFLKSLCDKLKWLANDNMRDVNITFTFDNFFEKSLSVYRAFHEFGQAKFPDRWCLVLGSSQFSILPQLPLKTMLGLNVVKIDSKISNLLR